MRHITTISALRQYLEVAVELEHATIPPYLTALYSIRPDTNSTAVHVLRVIVVEEMLHLTIAANVLNAIGGTPDLTRPGFVPRYPAYLPDGEQDFQVHLQPFSKDALSTFLKIERPTMAPSQTNLISRPDRSGSSVLCVCPINPKMHYYSIGEFYREIQWGLKELDKKAKCEGKTIFTGDPKRQVTSEYYYSGGGELHPVTDFGSASEAIRLIAEQGEGEGGGIYDHEKELAHYYRFDELLRGRIYRPGDQPDNPTGPVVQVDWTAVYPIKRNARLADYPEGSELKRAAVGFNQAYANFLRLLTRAYNGQPEIFLNAVPEMFKLRNSMLRLIKNPLPGSGGLNAAPTFEIDPGTAFK